ncbi:MAG: CaiB/BaiF CoA-transferase family protein, partial [Thermoprotei archaeon]|nr:CaiB/BaiF CoA-transferase family protein [Thermoprotei archaeon]
AVFAMSYIAMIYLLTGRKPGRWGHAHPSIVPYQAFQCSDGKWLALAVTNDRFWENLCKALGMEELCRDERFSSNPKRVENRGILIPILESKFREKPRDYWLKILEDNDVPCGPVYEVDEVFDDAHVKASGVVGYVKHSKLGLIKQLLYPALFNGIRLGPKGPPPMLGEHTNDVLRELGYSDGEIDKLRREGVIA